MYRVSQDVGVTAAPGQQTVHKRIVEYDLMMAVQKGKDASEELAQAGVIELSGDFVRSEAAKYRAEDALKTTIQAVARSDGRNHIKSLVTKAEMLRTSRNDAL